MILLTGTMFDETMSSRPRDFEGNSNPYQPSS